MRNKREENDIAAHQKKRYQFMKEQVRPQQKKQVFQWVKRAGILVVAAVLFGVIAGSIMVLFQNHFVKPKENVVTIDTYTTVPEETEAPELEDSDKGAGNVEALSLSQVNKITQRLAAVGTGLSPSLVGILQESSAQSILTGDTGNMLVAYGLLVQETDEKYYILTTNEIIQERSFVPVQLVDNTTIEGRVLGCDTQLDMAVVQIEKSGIKTSLRAQMKVVQFGNGIKLMNGSNVIAVGCPNGVLRSVTVGRITNDSIKGAITDGEVQLYCTDMPYTKMGNGVVLDVSGKVVGIITTGFIEKTGTACLSFMKMANVMPVLELLKQKQNAPYLGIEGSSLGITMARAHQLETGAYVTEVYSGSPAYEGGMRVADVITKIDGKKVSSMSDIYQSLLKHRPGDEITYTVSRKAGKEQIQKKIKIVLK